MTLLWFPDVQIWLNRVEKTSLGRCHSMRQLFRFQGEEVPPRRNLFHDPAEDEGDCRGLLGIQNQRRGGMHLRSRKTKTSVHREASATAHVVRSCSSTNFSAILLNLLQMMGKSVAVLAKTTKPHIFRWLHLEPTHPTMLAPRSQYRPTSTILSVRPPRMQVPSQAWMSSASSMSLLLQLSPMALTRKALENAMCWSMTWVEVLSMCLCWPLRMVSLRWKQLQGTRTWVVKTLTIEWWISASRTSSERIVARTWLATSVPSVVCELSVSVPSALCLLLPRQRLKSIPCSKAWIILAACPGHASRSCAWITSVIPWALWRSAWKIPASTRRVSMMWSWWVVPPEFPRCSPWSRSSSTARNPTGPSTQMRPWLMVQLCRRLFLLVKAPQQSRICCCWMWLHCPWVWRRQVVWWPSWLNEIPPFPPRRLKLSLPMQTTSQVCWFRSLKESEPWPRITTCWASSTWMVFLQPHVVCHRSRSPMTSMLMASWTWVPRTSPQESPTRLPSPMRRVDCHSQKLTEWLMRLRNSVPKTSRTSRNFLD